MNRPPSIRHRLGLLASLGAMLLLASCARELPTAAPHATSMTPHAGSYSASDYDADGCVVVSVHSGVQPGDVASAYSASVVRWDANDAMVMLMPPAGVTPAALATQLAADPRVAASEPDGYLETAEARQQSFAFDDGLGSDATMHAQPATAAIHLADAQLVSTGAGVRVAILDTGIDPTHPAFTGRIAAGWDFVDDDADPTDVRTGVDRTGNGLADESWGHGTHVAGIVATTAPGAQLLIGRVLDSEGRGDVLAVAAGIHWAVRQGARVINLSLGTLTRSDAIQKALQEAAANGVVVVASAGNSGTDHPAEYPATADQAWAVAAADSGARPATWSSYGEFVAITAPGVAVRSAYPGGAYRLWSGTSMSTPFVAGTAALLLAIHPSWRPFDVMQRIGASTGRLHGVYDDVDERFGRGMLDAGAALGPDYMPSVLDPAGDPIDVGRGGLH